jgi:hypothetical protein
MNLQGFNVGQKEVITVGAWYIWWIRRQLTYNEPDPPLFKCKISILSMSTNLARILSKPISPKEKWMKPEPRILKVNIDGSFHPDSHAGSTGEIMRDFEVSLLQPPLLI